MGLDFISFLKHKVSKEQKIAFIGTFVIALLIHLFHFSNVLPNHDSILNYYTDQNILGSGRWALSIACGFSSYFDLPWVIGILSCVFIALTAVTVITVLNISNPVLILLSGGLLAASPAITETFFFLFTADGYMIAMFLAALSVYLSRMEEKRLLPQFLSAACICISCGIYQAYVSFALILAICYFMHQLFLNQYSQKTCIRWIIRQFCIYVGALATYYIIWKLLMHITGTAANNYQGINEVGKLSLSLITGGIWRSVKSFAWYFIQWNVFKFGLTPYILLNLIFIVLFLTGLFIAVNKSGILRRPWALILVILCLIAIIPFACIWHFTSESVIYRAMMLQSLTVLFIFAGVLYETWAEQAGKNLMALLLFATIANNSLMANIGYSHLHLCYEQTYAEGLYMMQDIRELQQKHSFSRIAVIGNRHEQVAHYAIDPYSAEINPVGQIQIFSELLEKSMLYDSSRIVSFLKTIYGIELESVPRQERKLLFETEAVQSMPVFPVKGSLAVIDNILIVKISDGAPY